MSETLGTVAALWRYPVKSLRGEALERVAIGPSGVPGDRAFALRDVRDGRILSAKRTAALLAFRAVYPEGPERPALIDLRWPAHHDRRGRRRGSSLCPPRPCGPALRPRRSA